uniref:BHLH domain-containing protein n=1 Tax=Aegilops tauschii TaxID=37682 RepID=M8AU43_AEGTA
MALRDVIPGGRHSAVDEVILLREAMDYAVHLCAQVDVLRRLSEAVKRSSSMARLVAQRRAEIPGLSVHLEKKRHYLV